MSSELATLEGELKEYKLQLETVQSGIQADPDNAELQNLKVELEEVISLTDTAIAELRPVSAPPPPRPAADADPPPVREKWSQENHPAYQAGYRRPASTPQGAPDEEAQQQPAAAAPASFAVNDSVLARWASGDNAYYPARITSITGSSSAPVYIVTFKSYATTETLKARDLKPLSHDAKKRKAADSSSSSTTTTPPAAAAAASAASPGSPAHGSVISAAANIDQTLASQARHEPSRADDGPARPAKVPRKVKANKELEAGKSKWQEFAAKGKMGKSTGKKDSMFRTPEGVHGRVGFTGSGQSMRKDAARSRHIYQHGAEEESYQ